MVREVMMTRRIASSPKLKALFSIRGGAPISPTALRSIGQAQNNGKPVRLFRRTESTRNIDVLISKLAQP
jgi:hypothetical protein